MKIITVSGAHSGVGKTRVVEGLLKGLKGWSALKVTVLHNGACPTHRDCGACDAMESKFSIVDDEARLGEFGKDTGRFKAAGAKNVLWLRARSDGLRAGLKKAMSGFKDTNGIVIEGTSVLRHIKPDLAILVKNRNSNLKPSAKEALKKVDLVLTI